VWLVAAMLLLAGVVVVIDRIVLRPDAPAPATGFMVRPDLASIIDGLVIGSARTSPGATAYVSGPDGAWSGSAGVANVRTRARIQADARVRLESISKLFIATIVLQLEQAGKLKLTDTVAR
jgi:D-alanyl-D-alanine carboxypeptidase